MKSLCFHCEDTIFLSERKRYSAFLLAEEERKSSAIMCKSIRSPVKKCFYSYKVYIPNLGIYVASLGMYVARLGIYISRLGMYIPKLGI